MEVVHIRLFGGCEISLGEEFGSALRAKKAKALLAYLALQHGVPVSRQKLAELFWSDREDKQARRSLRQSLTTLRKYFAVLDKSPLLADGSEISLDKSAIDLDVNKFVILAKQGDLHSLRLASNLYREQFLDGCDAGCPAFEEWLGQERRRYHVLAVQTNAKLMDIQTSRGCTHDAIETAFRLLELDPLREKTHRSLMRSHAALGEFNKALSQFEHCREILMQELGVEPEIKTSTLANELRTGRLAVTTGSDFQSSPPDRKPEAPADTQSEVLEEKTSLATENLSWAKRVLQNRLTIPAVSLIVAIGVVALNFGPFRDVISGSSAASNFAAISNTKPSIAVLPFENISGKKAESYFSDGLSEDLITDLSGLAELRVIARNSSFQYRGELSLGEIRDTLNVDFVLAGSVRREESTIRINANLIETQTGSQVWAKRYDGAETGLFVFQDEIAADIVKALKITITPAERNVFDNRHTNNVHAFDYFQKGQQSFRLQTPSGLADALKSYKVALEIDPQYSQAEAALANAYLFLYSHDWYDSNFLESLRSTLAPNASHDEIAARWETAPQYDGQEAYDPVKNQLRAKGVLANAVKHAKNALKSEFPPALAHTVLAKALYFGPPKPVPFEEAVEEARKGIKINPSDTEAYLGLGQILIFGGEPERAIVYLELARKLDPLNGGIIDHNLALAYFHLEQFSKASDHIELALDATPEAYFSWLLAAATYAHLDDEKKTVAAINRGRVLRKEQGRQSLFFYRLPELGTYRRPQDRMRLREGLIIACELIGEG